MIAYLIPDRPEWVEIAVDTDEYQSRLAYKRQVEVSTLAVSSLMSRDHSIPWNMEF